MRSISLSIQLLLNNTTPSALDLITFSITSSIGLPKPSSSVVYIMILKSKVRPVSPIPPIISFTCPNSDCGNTTAIVVVLLVARPLAI